MGRSRALHCILRQPCCGPIEDLVAGSFEQVGIDFHVLVEDKKRQTLHRLTLLQFLKLDPLCDPLGLRNPRHHECRPRATP